MKKFTLRDAAFYALILVILVGTLWTLQNMNTGEKTTYAQVRRALEQQQVETVLVDKNNNLILGLKDGSTLTYELYSFELFYQDFNDTVVKQWRAGIITDYEYPDDPTPSPWLSMLPYVGILLAFGFMFYLMFVRQNGAGGGDKTARFGRARTRTLSDQGEKKVTFEDVAGADEEKEELQEIVEFLRDPKKFVALGARIPKGVLLVGPPGTGKTLLAKAVAGEAGVNFLSISGSDFVELYVGVGASRVRDLFDQAKKDCPAIVFIDEIDAVGRQRGAGLGGGHDEREQTLNQLLVEMDGFSANEGVIVPPRHEGPGGHPEGPLPEKAPGRGCGPPRGGQVHRRLHRRRPGEPDERGRPPGRPEGPALHYPLRHPGVGHQGHRRPGEAEQDRHRAGAEAHRLP